MKQTTPKETKVIPLSEIEAQIQYIMDISSKTFLTAQTLDPMDDADERFKFIIEDDQLCKKYALGMIFQLHKLIFNKDEPKNIRRHYAQSKSTK